MQPLVPYLLGQEHPEGERLTDSQLSFRAEDIEEVGDNRHTTFFRMLGNWSLGDYFKKDEIPWLWDLLTKEFKLPKEKLYITIFRGSTLNKIEPDNEAYVLWKNILLKENLDPDKRIFWGDVDKNWWSRAGDPAKMPPGEIGGPDTEVYYKFDGIEHTSYCEGKEDTPILCECGKFLEIANSVFIQYQKQSNGDFKGLPQKNVDYGGGMERLLAAIENKQDIFETSLFNDLRIKLSNSIKEMNEQYKSHVRIFLDHSQAATFLISEGVFPGNKDKDYVLRKLIRKADDQLILSGLDDKLFWKEAVYHFTKVNRDIYDKVFDEENILQVILEEIKKYEGVRSYANRHAIELSISANNAHNKPILIRNLERYNMGTADPSAFMRSYNLTSLPSTTVGSIAFDAQATKGYPAEETMSIASQMLGNILIPIQAKQAFEIFKNQHQKVSSVSAGKKFAGGLADHSEQTIMGHTATHLLHKALRDMFGEKVQQAGSNITPERLRFDFSFDRNLTAEEIKKIEETVNQKIIDNLPVRFEMLPLEKAKKSGAIGLFNEKYSDKVKVYSIGNYSKEICGGPHVTFTSEIKSFRIIKQENIGKGNRRIYAKIG